MEYQKVYCLECGAETKIWFHTDALIPYYHHPPNGCKLSGMKIMANTDEAGDEPVIGHFRD
jgi:hypothetical protein